MIVAIVATLMVITVRGGGVFITEREHFNKFTRKCPLRAKMHKFQYVGGVGRGEVESLYSEVQVEQV